MVFLTAAVLGTYLLAGGHLLNRYFGSQPVLLAGLLLLPCVLVVSGSGRRSDRYGWLALALLAWSMWVPVRTLYFLAVALAGLGWVERKVGRVNHLPLFLLAVLSPVFQFSTTVFSFPIRLQLSEWAGSLLRLTGLKTEVAGNLITVNGADFSVDPACVGLNLLTVSLLICLLLVAYHERKTPCPLPGWLVGAALLVTVALNLAGNLTRIVLLVLFRIPPDDPLHDAVGVGCLLGYVVLPLVWLLPRLFRLRLSQAAFRFPLRWATIRFPNPFGSFPARITGGWHSARLIGGHGLLVVLVLVRGWTWEGKGVPALAGSGPVAGYQREVMASGISKFSKKDALLYVKPVAEFYDAEHTPLVCWRGSGYEFKQINRERCAGQDVYTGILQKGNDRIYTAWWFDNGRHKTISQAEWRVRMGRGEAGFSLINVNCGNQPALMKEVNALLQTSIVH
ncbi:MAG: archaeosortase/exosortase family protein [Ferruginibacter sp.]|nr:archaeosortase/exosortase family protein [Cytophagales bacterium]